ncbi:MAG TPA: Uma2 family endonuclease, partial [Chloroflexota bacterium]
MAAHVMFSYEDLLHTPDDGKRYEIVDGEMLVSPSPVPKHQWVALKLIEFLLQPHHAGYGQLWVAPLDVILDEHNVVEPDLLFIRQDRLHIIHENNVHGAPDLVVEILSPGGRERD